MRIRTAIEPAHPQDRLSGLLNRLLLIQICGRDELLLVPNIEAARQRGPTLNEFGQEAGIRTRTVRFTGEDAAVTPRS